MDYQKHLQEDGAVVSDGSSNVSLTPTFASVAMYLRDPRWHRMPFILVSGKQLDERTAYARIVFKQKQFHVGQRPVSNRSPCLPEIIFLIQNEQISSPGILISEQLSSTQLMYPTMESVIWTQEGITYPRKDSSNSCKYIHLHPSQAVEANAYVSVIQAVLEGRQEYFIDTDSLLLSWEVWSPLLHQIELSNHSLHLSPYTPDMLDGLDFELSGASMRPKNDISTVVNATTFEAVSEMRVSVSSNVSTYWTELLGHRTIIADKYTLSYLLAEDLLRAAQKSVEERSRGEFHVALPGGQSPLLLMNALSLDFYHLFPWQQAHIWQTDERCVKATSADSNWNQISEHLLSVVPIPFHNLHPMPVDLQNGVCNNIDNYGDLLYQKTLDDGKLDHVVLGVGTDGHIASLFPETATLATSDNDDFVKITELKDSYNIKIKKRMTLSFDAILQARSVAVLVMGAGKETVMERVAQCLRLEGHCDIPLARLLNYISMDRLAVYVTSKIL
jgi:hexose-6-phosphate dehydrogenase